MAMGITTDTITTAIKDITTTITDESVFRTLGTSLAGVF